MKSDLEDLKLIKYVNRISLAIDQDTYKRLNKIKKNGINYSEWLRRLIKKHLSEIEGKTGK